MAFVIFKLDLWVLKRQNFQRKSKKAASAPLKEIFFIYALAETKFHNLFQVRKGGNSIWPQNVAVLYLECSEIRPSGIRRSGEAIKTYCSGPFQMKCSEKHKSPDGFVDCCGLTGTAGRYRSHNFNYLLKKAWHVI
jgi:hypothetical protein